MPGLFRNDVHLHLAGHPGLLPGGELLPLLPLSHQVSYDSCQVSVCIAADIYQDSISADICPRGHVSGHHHTGQVSDQYHSVSLYSIAANIYQVSISVYMCPVIITVDRYQVSITMDR